MPYYYFEAAAADGKIQKKILKARDKKDVDLRLRNSGLRPMLVENYRVTKKKKRQKALHTRHIIRNTLSAVACVSLVGGVAAYFVMLDIGSLQRVDLKNLARSGIVREAPGVVSSNSAEGREFASEVLGALNTNYPETFTGATVERKSLMVIYMKKKRSGFSDEALESIVTMLTRAFQREFDTSNCMVFIVRADGETMAECRYRRGDIQALVY